MSGVGAASRVTVQRLGAVVVVLLASLVAGCGLSGTPQSRCESPGKVYSQRVLVNRDGKKDFEWITLFLVCKPDRHVGIVDSEGKDYESLDDFRANNKLLDEDDKITLPRDFPAVERQGDVELMTVSGHTGTPWPYYLVGAVSVMVIIGCAVWVYRRRQVRRDWPEETGPPVEQPES